MDKLHGVDSLPVVLHRFSDGVEVVKCVVDFCNEVATLEKSYSESLHRLLRSSSYTFHSNLLFQWLGSNPYEEIGSLKYSWQELGQELCKLADLHSEQAEAYQNSVRKPLMDLLPELEEARRNMRVKILQIKEGQEQAHKKMNKEKQKYMGLGDSCERLQQQIRSLKSTGITARIRLPRIGKRLDSTEKQLLEQEQVYNRAHGHYLEAQRQCDETIQDLYKKHEEREVRRVNALKEALLNFTKTLSNTAPAYLEGMQRIQMSVEKIDAVSDIQWFVNEHTSFQTTPQPPQLEKHSFVRDGEGEERENGRQSPIGGTGDVKEEEEEEGEKEGEPLGHTGVGGGGEEEETAKGKRGPSKWPLGRVWGGIRGKLRANEVKNGGREEKEGQESDGEILTDEEDSSNQRQADREGVRNTPELPRDQDTREKEGNDKELKPRVRKESPRVARAPGSVERSGGASGSRGKREMASNHQTRERRRRRDDVKPTPNPKPTRLRGKASEESSESEGVKFSSLSGSLKLEVETVEEGLKQPRNTPHRPQRQTNHEHQQTMKADKQEAATTPQRRKRRPQIKEKHDQDTRRNDSSDAPQPLLPNLPVLPTTTPTTQSPSSSRPKPPLPTKPLVLEKPVDGAIATKLQRLQEMAEENDYYKLFGVESTAGTDELARVRREMSRQLHPDHFAGQSHRQERAQQELMLINQVFQDVLKSFETRTLYDQLCQFRPHYVRIPDQKQRGLQVAHSKLFSLHKQLKKHRAPLSLLTELTFALDLITTCQQQDQSTTPG